MASYSIRSTSQPSKFKCRFGAKKSLQIGCGIWCKFDQKIHIAFVGIKVVCTRRRAEHFQLNYVKASANVGNTLPVLGNGAVHDGIVEVQLVELNLMVECTCNHQRHAKVAAGKFSG